MAKKATTLKDKKALGALDVIGLTKELHTTSKELYVLRMKLTANELKQPHLIRAHRKQIARLNTLITQSSNA